jgi:hypothetical protein
MAAFAFATPRGHKRSIKIRMPSSAPGFTYARFNPTFAAAILLLKGMAPENCLGVPNR